MTRRGPWAGEVLPDDCRAAIEAAGVLYGADPLKLFAPPRARSGAGGFQANRARWAGFVALARRDGDCPIAVAVRLGVYTKPHGARDGLRRVARTADDGRGPLAESDLGVAAALAAIGAAGAPALLSDPLDYAKPGPLSQAELDQIRARLKAGESGSEIARSMDRSPDKICALARQWGIGLPPAPPRQVARPVPDAGLAPPRSTARTFGRPATRWVDSMEAGA